MKTNRNKLFVVYAALILAVLFWGFSYVWSSIVFKYWTPITAIFVRLFFCTIILFTVLKLTKKLNKIDRKDYKYLVLSGTLTPFLYFIFEGYGLKYSSPTICSVFISTIPVSAAIAAVLFLKERLSLTNIIGMILSLIGVFMLIIKPDFSLAAQPKGIIFLVLCVLSAVIHTFVVFKLSKKYNPFTIVAYEDLIGLLLFAPLFFIFDFNHFVTTPINSELILMMSLLIVFAGSLAFPFHIYGLKELGVSRSSFFSNIIPVFTAIASYFIINEKFYLNQLIAILIVIIGVFLVQLRNKEPKQTLIS